MGVTGYKQVYSSVTQLAGGLTLNVPVEMTSCSTVLFGNVRRAMLCSSGGPNCSKRSRLCTRITMHDSKLWKLHLKLQSVDTDTPSGLLICCCCFENSSSRALCLLSAPHSLND